MSSRTVRLPAGILLVLLGACATNPRPVPETDDPHLATAYEVLSTTPLIDGHNDLPWRIRSDDDAPMDVRAYDLDRRTPGHTDIPRLRAGRVGGQFWSVYVPAGAADRGAAARIQLEQIDIARRMIDAYPGTFELATSPEDVERIFADGKVASMLGMEGGHAIENSLGALRAFHDLGARYMTLTHSANVDWADSCCEEPAVGGLSAFGEEVVREMNRLGMLVDISHVSAATMHDVLDVSEAPVIFSHSSAYSLTDHPRNVPDDLLRRMADNGGVVMVTFVTVFVDQALKEWWTTPADERSGPAPEATLSDVADHIEHVRNVAGIDHVGIGSDFDGASMPVGLEDVATFPALLAELSRRGWTAAELRKLAGENVLRAWRQADTVARRLQETRPPSVATIAELDGGIAADTAAFVTRLGNDTLAVERFRFSPSGFQATAAVRVPRTRLVRYTGQLDHHGNLRSLEVRSYDPDAPPPGGAATGGANFTFTPGGVLVDGRNDDGEFEFTVDADPSTIPFFELIHWPFELALKRHTPTAHGDTVPMITGRQARPFVLTTVGEGRVRIRHPYRGIMAVDLDEEGRIRTLDASATTRKLRVERVDPVDVLELGREFARRDAAGRGIGALSGRGEAVGDIGGTQLAVDYGVPRKRGREIFGGLVPFHQVWRTGANRATHLTTDGDLVIGGARVPAGRYTLFTVPGPEEWTLIVNGATDITGTAYDAEADLARVPMDVRTLDEPAEAFTIEVDPDGYLRMRWDRTEAYVAVRTP